VLATEREYRRKRAHIGFHVSLTYVIGHFGKETNLYAIPTAVELKLNTTEKNI